MCRVESAKLANHVVSTLSADSAASCVAKCSADKDCKSANYNTSTGSCELNDINGPAYEGVDDYDDNAGTSNIHFHSLEC
jgi:hypothetical protein